MIRLPANAAAVTAPFAAAVDAFPGIRIGKSLLDGRAFDLSPVLVDQRDLPSTIGITLGGLGSGKSTTDKIRAFRENRRHQDQFVVVDSFGERKGGEWTPVTEALGGLVVRAGEFTLNPCSPVLPHGVPEELIRALILAVEPQAMNPQCAHALQHAVANPKAVDLRGVRDALVHPEAGTWPAAKLRRWGEGAAIALDRYISGSLAGLFDGDHASLPPVDSPMTTFDFSGLDRNSPAIPALMSVVAVWIEHVWLPQAPASHRHLVLEEAWEILRNPATTGLIQRIAKNSRKASLSIQAIMHTLSDLGEGQAQDLAKLCEIAHVGRLTPPEAALVGELLGLPQWAVEQIPRLEQGEAVWKVGPHYVDIIKTVLETEEEVRLTDTSSRRRQAQKAAADQAEHDQDPDGAFEEDDQEDEQHHEEEEHQEHADAGELPEELPRCEDSDYVLAPPAAQHAGRDTGGAWDFDMPPTVIDSRHHDVVQAAREGRHAEASDLAVLGESQDIRAHGINSDQALSWLSTRAKLAELNGRPETATLLRANVTRMGRDVEWWEQQPANTGTPMPVPAPAQPLYGTPPPAPSQDTTGEKAPSAPRRRTWPYIAVIAVLALTAGGIWQKAETDRATEARQQTAAAYKGQSGASLLMDDVDADVVAQWTRDRDRVIIELRSFFETNAQYLRIEADGQSAVSTRGPDRYIKDPQLEVPVSDPLADVTVRIVIGGKIWKEGAKGTERKIRLSPSGAAFDADTGERLPGA
ncbi:hypothetical protein [Streptomyces sp. NBC_01264]|uniref:hypothetical protein n=1 Tax=Streptomyces sp. NBC_01264 TaxID=2903804 RepID=UPI00224D6CE4|nr:hypothetical protein [Streptomyces sp. NBC_01264]MCX4784572.1 hypothetical protein [Streptomyces sp. NBC_01264]